MRRFLILSTLSALALLADDDCKLINQPCATKSEATQAVRSAKIRDLYGKLVYPTPLGIISTPPTVPIDHIFEQSVVRGRVTPAGQFPGFEAAREYFFALAVAGTSRVERVNVKRLVASGSEVAVEVDIFFCTQAGPCPVVTPQSPTGYILTQTGFFIFNMNDKVIGFDLNILNLGAAADQPEASRPTQIAQLCGFLTLQGGPTPGTPGTCTSSFDQASDYPAGFPFSPAAGAFGNCVAYMNSIPFGSWNRANSNTVVCRTLHSLMTPLRPGTHCPHTSPSGGAVCVDVPYSDFYTTSLFDFTAVPAAHADHGDHADKLPY